MFLKMIHTGDKTHEEARPAGGQWIDTCSAVSRAAGQRGILEEGQRGITKHTRLFYMALCSDANRTQCVAKEVILSF